MTAVKLSTLSLPGASATSKLAWFGATLLLATPSALDQIKDNSETDIRAFLAGGNVTGPLQDEMLAFIRAVANDPTTRKLMADLHDALLNRPSTSRVYDQNICPGPTDSQEILRRLAT